MSCMNANSAAWKKRNPDAFTEWAAENAAKRTEYHRTWYAQNKEIQTERYRVWAKQNSHITNAIAAKRNAAKYNATPSWANQDAIRAIYAEAARLTRETGIRHEVDHIYPLQGELVCGLHVEANLQILTKFDNIRKKNRMPEEFGYV